MDTPTAPDNNANRITSYCNPGELGTDHTCGVCGVKATPQTIGRWFIDEDPAWDRCDEHHPAN